MRLWLMVCLGAVAAVAVGGCGGDDSSTTSTTASLTSEEFVTQGNEICAQGNETIDAAGNEAFGDSQPTQAELDQFVADTVIPSIEEQLTALQALGVPEGDEEQVGAMLDAAEQSLSEVQADPSLLATNDADPFAEVNALFNDYGLTECGS